MESIKEIRFAIKMSQAYQGKNKNRKTNHTFLIVKEKKGGDNTPTPNMTKLTFMCSKTN